MSQYKNQYHIFRPLSIPLANINAGDYTTTANLICPFPVKEARFSFAYTIRSDLPIFYILSSSLVNNEPIGALNKFSGENAGIIISSDTFSKVNEFRHIFKEPMNMNRPMDIFLQKQSTDTSTLFSVVMHVEMLGD